MQTTQKDGCIIVSKMMSAEVDIGSCERGSSLRHMFDKGSKTNNVRLSGMRLDRDAIYYAIWPRVKLSWRAYLRASSICASSLNTRAYFLMIFHLITVAQHRVEYIMWFTEIAEMRFNGWTRLFACFHVIILYRVKEVTADKVTWSNFALCACRWSSDPHLESIRSLNTFLSDIRKWMYAFSVSITHPYSVIWETHFIDCLVWYVHRINLKKSEVKEGRRRNSIRIIRNSIDFTLIETSSLPKTMRTQKMCISHVTNINRFRS